VDYLSRAASRSGVPLVLDPAPAQPLPASLMKRIAWLTPNESEAGILCGAAGGHLNFADARQHAESLLRAGPKNVVIKMSRHGAYWATDGFKERVPPFRVRAVDSTAAGDAFNAGLAVALMKGQPSRDALRFASAVAALSVSRAGAQSSMPAATEVERFLSRKKGGAGGGRSAQGS
jgi:ribokinase